MSQHETFSDLDEFGDYDIDPEVDRYDPSQAIESLAKLEGYYEGYEEGLTVGRTQGWCRASLFFSSVSIPILFVLKVIFSHV